MFLNGAAHRIVTGDNFQPSDLTVSQMASLLCAGRNMIHRPNSQILWVQFQTHQRKVRGVTFAGQGLAFSLCLKKKKKKPDKRQHLWSLINWGMSVVVSLPPEFWKESKEKCSFCRDKLKCPLRSFLCPMLDHFLQIPTHQKFLIVGCLLVFPFFTFKSRSHLKPPVYLSSDFEHYETI